MFKDNWEKTEIIDSVAALVVIPMILHVFPDAMIVDLQMISGGCANINIKFTLDEGKPLLLRIYLRDKDASYKEQAIAEMLASCVPVPKIYFIGDCDGYRYAITEFMQGITLRDFLLNHCDDENMSSVMYDCGKMLASIASYRFEAPGFFDRNLSIEKTVADEDLQNFITKSLQHANVTQQLNAVVIDEIAKLVVMHADSFPDAQAKNLVHGDYDPANILVSKQDGQWKISAVLDFEFAFSGSWLWDVANMLRYAHKMPTAFKTSFLKGITDFGFILPRNWPVTLHLLNLASLLDCLTRSSMEEKPHQYRDICELLDCIVGELKKAKYEQL